MFGEAPESPQREQTPCAPTNPYGIAKLAAHQMVGAMRTHHGLHLNSGIVFNHESERRPPSFVTRRVTRGAAAIALGLESELTLGSLDAVRDWSFAGDIVRGAWLMLQQEQPGDYVLASGVPHTVAELVERAFECVELDHERYVRVDPELVREPERTPSVGDPTLARERLGWQPTLSFEQLVERMVAADLRSLQARP
jgi:GDPmannose 4,6-dehydratase